METSLKSKEYDSMSARPCNRWDSTSTIDIYPLKLRAYLCFKLGIVKMYISDGCCHKKLGCSFSIDKYFSAGIQVNIMGTSWRLLIKII